MVGRVLPKHETRVRFPSPVDFVKSSVITELFFFRLPSAKYHGDSILMYIGGEINLTQFNEEIVESDLVRELSKSPNPQRTLEQLRDSLLHIQTQLRKYDPAITLLPEKFSPDKLFNDVVEAYSTLQAVDIIHRADRLPLTARAKSIINHALAYSDLARATRTMGEAWASFANSEQGKSYLETTGKTLTDLLDTAGIQLSSHYSDLRTAEADRIDVASSKNFARDAAAERSELDAAADAAADTRVTADLPATEIPAEESLTGAPLTIDPRETADNAPTDSTYTPPADAPPPQMKHSTASPPRATSAPPQA